MYKRQAVGDPKFDNDPTAKVRPEQGLLAMRKKLGLFANIRPVQTFKCLLHKSCLLYTSTSLEEVAMIIKCHKDIEIETNINTQKIYPTTRIYSCKAALNYTTQIKTRTMH